MKILYIENNIEDINLLKMFFKHKGINIDYETRGEAGLLLAITNKYDFIILDINIDKISGIEICKRVREEGLDTPIIFLTGISDYKILLDSLKSGGDDFMKKPFHLEELYFRMQSILRRPKQYVGNFIKIDNFTLDLHNKRFYYDDLFINLTKKELSLIEFFMRNKDQVLTREDILENVWDMNANPFSNIVEVYIRNVRLKLKQHSNKDFINNIQGIGYYIGNVDKITKDKFYNN